MKIDGPWAFKDQDGVETPVYIFAPGAVRMEIGVARAKIARPGGLQFEIELQEAYKDVTMAAFELPMRFTIQPHLPDDGSFNLVESD